MPGRDLESAYAFGKFADGFENHRAIQQLIQSDRAACQSVPPASLNVLDRLPFGLIRRVRSGVFRIAPTAGLPLREQVVIAVVGLSGVAKPENCRMVQGRPRYIVSWMPRRVWKPVGWPPFARRLMRRAGMR